MSISKSYKLIKKRVGRALVGRNPFDLAYFFCKGIGLEVGARNNPYPFGKLCSVSYADIGDEAEIKNILINGFRIGKLFGGTKYIKVNHILKGPKYGLEGIDQNSYDFVYSDNVLEHTPNPIFALVEQLRVTKIGGYVYVVIPNKAYTFDRNRATTSIDLLIEKYQQDIFHYSVDEALDIILNTEDFPGELIINSSPLDFAKKMISENNGEYHFHVFDSQNILLLLDYVCLLTNSRLRYFSAPNRKHIHFAICKGAVE